MSKALLRFLPALALGVSALVGGGCGRAHLSSHYGESYSAWFTAQHVPARPQNDTARRSIETLDAQEAEMVSKSYRQKVGNGNEGASQGRQIMMVAPRPGAEAYMPPPSVPGGQ
jgi:hypothetical protein